MEDSYFLWKVALGGSARIELTEMAYNDILAAKSAILAAIETEEAWDALVKNYLEFEESILATALQSMVSFGGLKHEFNDMRNTFARRIGNFLSASKAYLDHTPQRLEAMGCSEEDFKSQTNKAYDDSFSYRFMEALRNYTQHRGFPVHSPTLNTKWVARDFSNPDGAEGRLRFWAGASVSVEKLLQDQKFKKSVAREIEGGEKFLDISGILREYVELLSQIHERVREISNEVIDNAKERFEITIDKYSAANSGDVLGLAASRWSNDEPVGKRTDIFIELVEWLDHLRARNRKLANLRLRYVSNELRSDLS